jgi:tRNA (adenine22-N1)-methyltransferase
MTIKLSERLEAVASFVEKGEAIADIGSDHGHLVSALFERGVIERAFAVENKEGPYSRLRSEMERQGLLGKVEVSLSDGISQLPSYVDDVIIAGMGGRLVGRIVEEGRGRLGNVKKVIVDAHSDQGYAIKALAEAGYHAADDVFLIEEGHAYCVCLFLKGAPERPYTETELLMGPIELKRKSGAWKDYWEREQKRYKNLLDNYQLSLKTRDEYAKISNMISEGLK